MHKILVLYAEPKDPEHFRKYYVETHLPLARQIPGLKASRHSFAIQGMGVPAPFFALWEGEFESEAAMGAAMSSEIGQKVGADVANYATGPVTLMHYETEEG